VNVVLFSDKYKKLWTDYLNSCTSTSFYHRLEWKEVLEEVFHFTPYYLLALDESEHVRGILPLFEIKDILQRPYLVSTPFANYAGIHASCKTAEKALLDKAIEMTETLGCGYLEIRQQSRKLDLPYTKSSFVNMVLRLDSSFDIVFKNSLKATTRNRIRKAQKSGLEAVFSRDHVDEFYKIFETNMKRLGTPAFQKDFFLKLLDVFQGNAEILTIWKEKKAVAGMFLFTRSDLLSAPWLSSLHEYNHYCPNNLMYWEAIKYACHRSVKYFEMGRSTVNSGTFHFKKQWGARPVSLNYQYYLFAADKPPRVDAFNNKYDFAIKVWKKLPMWLATRLSPMIVRHLPEL